MHMRFMSIRMFATSGVIKNTAVLPRSKTQPLPPTSRGWAALPQIVEPKRADVVSRSPLECSKARMKVSRGFVPTGKAAPAVDTADAVIANMMHGSSLLLVGRNV